MKPSTVDRTAAELFSTAVFRPIANGTATTRADRLVSELRHEFGIRDSTNVAVVEAAYKRVSQNYRREYFYRNLIASKLFVGRHRATNATMLNELKIGDSIADCVFLNGSGVVYEIKTEFDSPGKLGTQLESYYSAFTQTNVVVHERDVSRYIAVLDGGPSGLIAVGPRGSLATVRSAESDSTRLSIPKMFNILRRSEVESILTQYFGTLPVVPNGLRYGAYLELASEVEVGQFQQMMQKQLKGRVLRGSRHLLLNTRFSSLRAMFVQLNPNPRQQANLLDWLESNGR
jgi:hypothetical protein